MAPRIEPGWLSRLRGKGAVAARRNPSAGDIGALEDPESQAFAWLGDVYFSLLTNQDWVFRRVENVRVSGEVRFRRQISVDVELPGAARDVLRQIGDGGVGVPLVFATKEVFSGFDLTESGQTVPMWTQQQNERVARAVLHSVARTVGAQMTAALDHLIGDVIAPGRNPGAIEALMTEFGNHGASKPTLEVVRWVLTILDDSFIVSAEVPAERADQRLVFKIAFDEAPAVSPRFGTLIGWRPTRIRFRAPSAAMSPSYHFELEAPDGLDIVGGDLLAVVDGSATKVDPNPSRQETILHLAAPAGSHDMTSGSYEAVVALAPSRGGLPTAAALMAIFSTVVLWAGGYLIQNVRDGNVDASATLLLTIPGFLAAFVARPGEHRLVSRLLRGVRGLTIASGVAPFIAAATLLTSWSDRSVALWWFGLYVLDAVCVFLLLGVMLGSAFNPKHAGVTTPQ